MSDLVRSRIRSRFEQGPGFALRRTRRVQSHMDVLCGALLPWAERQLTARIGDWAAEHAGAVLFESLRQYEPERGVPLRPYLIQRLYWIARDHLRASGDWPDTAAARLGARTAPLLEGDGAGPSVAIADPAERVDEVMAMTRRINRLAGRARVVGLGLVMGEGAIQIHDVARMLGLDQSTLRAELDLVRQSARAA